MTRFRTLAVAVAFAAVPAAPAPAATLTYEPATAEIGTYVLTADSTGGDLILSGIVRQTEGGDPVQTIQFSYEGTIDYSAVPDEYCGMFEGDTRLYCGVAEGDGFRYEGTDAIDELSLGVGEDLYPWMAVTFNGRGGADKGSDDGGAANTALRVWDGGAGNDRITSAAGNDRLLGGDGDDVLSAGAGAQELRGGAGNDDLEGDSFSAQFGGDIIDGGAGNDEGGDWYIPSSDVHPPISVTQDGAANDGRPGENDNVTSIERISTGGGSGSFQGTEDDDTFDIYTDSSTTTLLGGNDKFEGRSGSETVDGGAGNDDLQGGFGNDTITGGPGQDAINADAGSYCGIYSCSVPFGNDVIDVRDGEADTVECGVGTDKVQADPVDTIAPSCEEVHRADAGGGGAAPGRTTPGATTPGGDGDFAFRFLGRPRLRTLLRSGSVFEVTCPGSCRVSGRLLFRRKAVAAGRAALLKAGPAKVRMRVAKKARRKLKRLRKARMSLVVTVTDASGKAVSFRKTLSFKK